MIKQWLEQMIVVLIDDGHVERSSSERLGSRQPAKSRPDDDDATTLGRKIETAHNTSGLNTIAIVHMVGLSFRASRPWTYGIDRPRLGRLGKMGMRKATLERESWG